MSEKTEGSYSSHDDENVDCSYTSNGKCNGCTLRVDEDCPYDDSDKDYDELDD
jgi:hypothetical protein